MPESTSKRVVQGEDIIILIDDKPTLHATTHSLKVDLELKDLRTKDTKGKEKYPGDITWSVDGDGLVVIDPTSLHRTHRRMSLRWCSPRNSSRSCSNRLYRA